MKNQKMFSGYRTRIYSGADKFGTKVSPIRLILTLAGTLMVMGLLVITFPRFFTVLLGSFFLFMALLVSVAAWKFYQFKKRFDRTVDSLKSQSSVVFDGTELSGDDLFGRRKEQTSQSDSRTLELEKDDLDDKKITWH